MSWLAGKTVVVTRAADQPDTLQRLLEARGATVVAAAVVRIDDDAAEIARLVSLTGELETFDWLICTSPRAARTLQAYTTHDVAAAAVRIAAIGAATANELGRCDLAPTTQNAHGMLDAFPDGPGRVLVVHAAGAAPTLVDGLVARGWQVTAVAPYRSVPAEPAPEVRTAALAADAVVFASGSAVEGWVAAFGPDGPPVRVAIGPHTSAVAAQIGLKISSVSSDHSLNGLVDSLDRAAWTGI
jgi:uroporphyrinogen-III synthase